MPKMILKHYLSRTRYTATIHTVSIVLPGVTIEEEHIAREILNRWNAENGKEKGKIYLPLPSDSTTEPDTYIFAIDNFVDKIKVEAAIATGAKVILFFRKYHDENNTLVSELQVIQELKASVTATCIEYDGPAAFDQTLKRLLIDF